MTTVANAIAADRRRVILRLLVECHGTLNSPALESGLRPYHGQIDRAMVHDDLRWLERHTLVTLEELGRHRLNARLTPSGERIAKIGLYT